MKRSAAAAFGFLVLAGTAGALDWGVNLNEVPLAILGQTTLYVESVKAKAWLSQPVFGAPFKLEGEGSFAVAYSGGSWTLNNPTFDLTEASLTGSNPLEGGSLGVVEWDAGRRAVTDLTGGFILSSRWDGAGFSWLHGSVKVISSVGFSGLLLKKSSKIIGSPADLTDLADNKRSQAPQRVYGILSLGWNEVIWRQDLQTEILGNWDLRPGNDAVHGLYATLATTGPLPLGLRQRFYGTVSFRFSPASLTQGLVAGGELSATLPFLGSRLVLNGVLTQGFGGFGFQPVSGKGLGEVASVSTAHGASAGVDFSFKPLAKTTMGVKATALVRTSIDPVALSGFRESSSDYWLGTEAGINASWTPSSELTFGLNGGIFLPQGGAFEAGTVPTILAVLTATLKL